MLPEDVPLAKQLRAKTTLQDAQRLLLIVDIDWYAGGWTKGKKAEKEIPCELSACTSL